jgi:hypothetical protein
MTFLWDPPVPRSWDLAMVLVSETSSLRPNSLPDYDRELPQVPNLQHPLFMDKGALLSHYLS